MIAMTLSELISPLQAQLVGESCSVSQVTTDTRQASSLALFVALVGERFDAHAFAEEAIAQGAVALLVEKELPLDVPQLVVSDTRRALGRLGQYLRRKLALPCGAITGSNGKTTVKEMCQSILSQSYPVWVTQGNFNNDIGVPLSLLGLESKHQRAVFELGANHIGEIAYTLDLVEPQVALINNISAAHIEGFGSREGVRQAKAELFAGLGEKQVAICDLDSPDLAYLQHAAAPAQLLYFSLSNSQADFYASHIQLNGFAGASFTLHSPAGESVLTLPLAGEHNVKNAVAAAALSYQLDASIQDIQQGLASLSAVPGRLQLQPLNSSVMVVNDSYNANPASFAAAIELLAQSQGKRILVAGEMGEMGEQSIAAHQMIVKAAQQHGLALYCFGEGYQAALSESDEYTVYRSHQALADDLYLFLQKEKQAVTILVKGSRSSHMEQVISLLQQYFIKEKTC